MTLVREIVVGYVEVDVLAYLPYFVTQERFKMLYLCVLPNQ